MKRILALILVMTSMASTALAFNPPQGFEQINRRVNTAAHIKFDLSGLTFEELVDLRDQINLAIWNSQEWQEVEVPKGVWIVGKDIPAGKWTIKAASGMTAYVYWGDTLDEAGTGISYSSRIFEYENLYSVSHRFYEKGYATEVTWNLRNGQYFIVESGIALFTPYVGKPSLGFK